MTLPVIGAFSLLLWYTLPVGNVQDAYSSTDYGIWKYLPSSITHNGWTREISLILCALSVYLMAELNNANMLLRVSSRMLSSMLALFLGISLNCHHLQPGHVLMLLSMMSFFPLFACYRQPSPKHVCMSFILISLSSFVFPHMIWATVIYWILLGVMRAFTFRCFVASILAILLPYWIAAGVAVPLGYYEPLLLHLRQMTTFTSIGNCSDIDISTASIAILTVLMFFSGSIDFNINRLLDRTRTRSTLNAVFIHGCTIIIAMALQPQHITVLQPVLLIDTAILFGHFFTLTHTRFSHIFMIAVLALAIISVMLQCSTICQDALHLTSQLFSNITEVWFD